MSNDTPTRRSFIKSAGWLLAPFVLSTAMQAKRKTGELLLYVGTYTSGKSEGIYLCRLNLKSGELTHLGTAKGVSNPSFLAIDARRRHLYAVNEETQFQGKPSGAVSAFAIHQQTGELTFLNQQPSLGGAPCHLSLDGTGKFVLLANYVGGNVAVLPLRRDGSLDTPSDMVQHQGSSVNRERQEGPHAHCIMLDRANRYAFAVDLGVDKILVYRFDATSGKLKPNQTPSVSLKPGAGPRHFVFHPSGRQAYVINELDSTITVFTYYARRGTLTAMQTVSTLPKDFSGANSCADIHLSPSGKFLYGSNRGHDSLAIFAIERGTGKLQPLGHELTQGKTPRNFAIDPTGAYLLAANQNSDSIVTFRIDKLTGKLTPTGHQIEVPAPVCLKLIPTFS
jgi:6-phosphogluconolactonase